MSETPKKKSQPVWVGSLSNYYGGRKRIRTSDFHRVRMALSPLSYPPMNLLDLYSKTGAAAIQMNGCNIEALSF
jgi:hypothetical protein